MRPDLVSLKIQRERLRAQPVERVECQPSRDRSIQHELGGDRRYLRRRSVAVVRGRLNRRVIAVRRIGVLHSDLERNVSRILARIDDGRACAAFEIRRADVAIDHERAVDRVLRQDDRIAIDDSEIEQIGMASQNLHDRLLAVRNIALACRQDRRSVEGNAARCREFSENIADVNLG